MQKIAFVFLGGGIGSSFRYGFNLMAIALNWPSFVPTFLVNVLGSALAGFLVTFIPEQWRLLLITGFCGGFTTFSAFNIDNLQLQQTSALWSVGLNMVLTVAVSFAAAWFGHKIGQGNI